MNEVIRDIFKKDFEVAEMKGRQDGINEDKERVATDMLKKNLPLSLIKDISKLSEDAIRNIAKTLGVAVF